ncbi:hypothetical protein SAMN05444166_4168 [Singulisphaera sp. GP187]|uniref:hypothetical protein n=1 Tax=Singulisphaera sp. GP187 TaxID=1882752 RepID=UPI00092AF761|nr:hypothetical protein [Singulisphaera sp. GP187]SIO37131.1 hypothetical protein SAMN05444166_4168 [Singulisphaera sp. GP187]
MPLFFVTVERDIDRTFSVTQESRIWVEAETIEAAEDAVEKLSHEGDAIDAYCRWEDMEDKTQQTSSDEDSVQPTGLRITDSSKCSPKKDRILRASDLQEDSD